MEIDENNDKNLVCDLEFFMLKDRAINNFEAEDLDYSDRKNKKYVVTLKNGNKVHFGDPRYEDFINDKDLNKRYSCRKRASKIRDKKGELK